MIYADAEKRHISGMNNLNDNRLIRRRLANSFVSSVLSISLVLMLVGFASVLIVNARSISNYFKENMQVSVMMKPTVSDEAALSFKKSLDTEAFVKSSRVVGKEQGAKEMADLLGDDFMAAFETSPIPVSIDMSLNADYVSSDSLAVIKSQIESSPLVDSVEYQKSLVDSLNANLSRISLFMLVLVVLLLFISSVLISNTVRLSVYARRFTIHTMQLVGATRSFIRRPFMVQAVFHGLFSALVAVIAIIGLLFVVRGQFAELFTVFRLDLLLVVIGIVVACGLTICLVSTYFVVNKLVSLKRDELYC